MTEALRHALELVPLRSESGETVTLPATVRLTENAGGPEVELRFGLPVAAVQQALAAEVERICKAHGVIPGRIGIRQKIEAHAPQGELAPLAQVRNIIAVGSGKGGVGKSTVAVNLALALAAQGARVGILDADIYGPSIPTMLGLSKRPDSPDGKSIAPLVAHGIEAMSIGLLVEQDTPMIWRGPMATSALTQLLNDTRWDDLDYLVVDLPPGTGDIQLTLAQKIPVAGAIVVSTPQEVATMDARKAIRMFEKVNVPVLGLVENMALHVCSNCGHAEAIFGEGGGARLAEQYGYPLLGRLPLEARIREQGDAGSPVVAADPDSAAARAFHAVARNAALALAARPIVSRPLSIQLAD